MYDKIGSITFTKCQRRTNSTRKLKCHTNQVLNAPFNLLNCFGKNKEINDEKYPQKNTANETNLKKIIRIIWCLWLLCNFRWNFFFLWDSSDVRLKYMNFIWCQIFYSFFTLFLNDANENFVIFKTCPFSGWWSVVLLNDSKSDLVFLMHVPCVCSLFIALSFQCKSSFVNSFHLLRA